MNDPMHDALIEEVKSWYKTEMDMDVPDWYASYKARFAFAIF